MADTQPPSAVEHIKADSRHLRGTIGPELARPEPAFSSDAVAVLKFHGIYQQDDRDVRRARTAAKQPLDYSCMVRAAVPGGVLAPEQWRAMDRVADLANGTLRLTTRQGVQFHTTPKASLRPLVAALNAELVTTLGACGDVVRNTMACPLPDGRQAVLGPAVTAIARRFRPRTSGYFEVWVDGERAATAEAPTDEEPLYGEVYLPRKFKIGLAWPGDNCIDVFSQDIGLVATLASGTTGELTGWVVLVGGGLGMSHAREDDTYPRLATPVCWVPPEELGEVAEAIVTMQRDHGNRTDRHRARLKYLVDERGLAWVRAQIEERMGHPVADPVELPPWQADDHHGHLSLGDGRWVLGVPVPTGRVADGTTVRLRTAVRHVLDAGLVHEVRVTPRQDLLLCGAGDEAARALMGALRHHGVALADDLSPVRRLAIACPALPTCGQALAEGERVLPKVVDDIEATMAAAGVAGRSVRINMTGCPNGCARPYTAEIGIVGRTKRAYDLYVGGSPSGVRLAERLRASVELDEIPKLLAPLFARYGADADAQESFGDYCHRVGIDALSGLLPEAVPTRRRVPVGVSS
jgi:sulfite reductase (ferredoxin)